MYSISKHNQRGDTIVEVLIAIAIVSLTLAGAYVSANQSANKTRTAQERAEAIKWAESQVELLKANTAALPPVGTQFCIDSITNPTNPTIKSNSSCNSLDPIPYKAVINQSSAGNFQVIVSWDALSAATGTNKVELDYIK